MKKTTQPAIQNVTLLLDRSGSMASILDATIEGVNAFIADQAKDEIPSRATLIQFDDQDPCETVYVDWPIGEVLPLTPQTFIPRGCTPLYDAIARAISLTEANPNHGKPIFVIVTDGLENASQEVSGAFVERLIETKEGQGWRFVYLGANQDAIREAAKIGIDQARAMTYATSPDKMGKAYSATARMVRDMKRGVEPEFLAEERKEQDDLFTPRQ